MKAILALEDGRYFEGEAFGSQGTRTGEICFNTSMTGYQEVLTDPSYRGQIVAMTYPLINPLFPHLRSGHPLFQRPSPQKQIPSNSTLTRKAVSTSMLNVRCSMFYFGSRHELQLRLPLLPRRPGSPRRDGRAGSEVSILQRRIHCGEAGSPHPFTLGVPSSDSTTTDTEKVHADRMYRIHDSIRSSLHAADNLRALHFLTVHRRLRP